MTPEHKNPKATRTRLVVSRTQKQFQHETEDCTLQVQLFHLTAQLPVTEMRHPMFSKCNPLFSDFVQRKMETNPAEHSPKHPTLRWKNLFGEPLRKKNKLNMREAGPGTAVPKWLAEMRKSKGIWSAIKKTTSLFRKGSCSHVRNVCRVCSFEAPPLKPALEACLRSSPSKFRLWRSS